MIKRILFSLILFIIFVLSLEGLCRLFFPAGTSDSLFLPYSVKGVDYWLTNRYFPRRYFFLPDPVVPTLSPELLTTPKSPETFRVFCLGESTTAGFPYQFNISYPFFLKQILQSCLPTKKVEVINLGVSAINSYAVSDMMPHLISAQPDLILLYLGHNEFYGSFGTASTQYRFGGYNLKKFYLKLLNLRSVSLFKHLLLKWSSSTTDISDQSLMSHLISARLLRHDQSVYQETISDYRRNLQEIVQFCRNRHLPLLISTLVSNTRNFPPFSSYHRQGFTPQDSLAWFDMEQSWRQSSSKQDSLAILKKMIDLDSVYAATQFQLGRMEGLAENYRLALDYDAVRFRAPRDIDRVIHSYHQPDQQVWVLDMEEHLQSLSPGGLVGAEFMTEHLHPNLQGYWEMASYYAEFIVRQFYPEVRYTLPELNDAIIYTDLDLYGAHKTIENLTRQAPYQYQILLYPELMNQEYTPVMDTLSRLFLLGKMSWADYHLTYGRFLFSRREYKAAGREFLALFTVFPQYPEYLMEAGDSLVLHDQNDKAMEFYQLAFRSDTSLLEALAKVSSLYYFDGQYPLAAESFEKLIRMNNSQKKLKPDDCIRIHRFQLDCCLRLGLWQEAMEEIRILRDDYGQNDGHLLQLKDRIQSFQAKGH